MSQMIFVNLPVTDLAKSTAFYEALGGKKNRQFSDAAAVKADPNPIQELGFMLNRSVEDPDGHVWEFFWMDPAATGGA